MNAVVEHKPQKPALVSGHLARAIVPSDFEGCWRLAQVIVSANMAPSSLETVEKCTVAIMHGLEVGMTPMAALQSIAVINGRPTIWGDGALALVRGSGLCEGIEEKIEGEGDGRRAICKAWRKGEKLPIVRTFSVADAIKAKLWGKAGPWQQYPDRMLALRARGFTLRDGFADVLRGLGITEEVADYHDEPAQHREERQALVAPPPPDEEEVRGPGPGANGVAEHAAQKAAERAPQKLDHQTRYDEEDLFERAEQWGRNLQDAEDVEAYKDEFGQHMDGLRDEDREHLEGIMARHIKRFD